MHIVDLFILVTFCMIFFGTLMYILDSAEPKSNIRNILGLRRESFVSSLNFLLPQMDFGLLSSR